MSGSSSFPRVSFDTDELLMSHRARFILLDSFDANLAFLKPCDGFIIPLPFMRLTLLFDLCTACESSEFFRGDFVAKFVGFCDTGVNLLLHNSCAPNL